KLPHVPSDRHEAAVHVLHLEGVVTLELRRRNDRPLEPARLEQHLLVPPKHKYDDRVQVGQIDRFVLHMTPDQIGLSAVKTLQLGDQARPAPRSTEFEKSAM